MRKQDHIISLVGVSAPTPDEIQMLDRLLSTYFYTKKAWRHRFRSEFYSEDGAKNDRNTIDTEGAAVD